MKQGLITGIASVALALCASAHADSAPEPLVGRWSVDTGRMPMPPEARPKSVLLTFADAGKDRLSMGVDIVYADGSQVHTKGINPLDGTPVAVTGSPEADSAAMRRPRADVLVVNLGRAGGPASTRVYTVAPDGKTMTETVSLIGDDGKPATRTHYFNRAR